MRGLMMDRPLLLTHFLERAEKLYPNREIATRTATGMKRTTYAQIAGRARRLASALSELGVGAGERVGTFAWNHDRHLELYFAIPGSGRVLHTLNIRLFAEQIAFIANHAEDRVIFVDDVLVPLLEKVAPELRHVRAYVVMGEGRRRTPRLRRSFATRISCRRAHAGYRFPTFDENEAAAMCYTSGTTGNPKGVLYSHRALYLQSMAHAMADGFGLCERDTRAGDRADVPRQRLVHAVRLHDGRREAGLSRAVLAGRRLGRAAREGAGDALGWRADDLDRRPRPPRPEPARHLGADTRAVRRLGGASRA